MEVEFGASKFVCSRCGMAYGKRKGNFPVSYAKLHKGIGYMPICKKCVDKIYRQYLQDWDDDVKIAVRQVCRKLDLYFDENILSSVMNKATTRNAMTVYMNRLTNNTYAGKSYDDTLINESGNADPRQDMIASLYVERKRAESESEEQNVDSTDDSDGTSYSENDAVEQEPIPEELISKWGPGYPLDMYNALEQRWAFWTSKYPEGDSLDIGTEAIIRQICSLELDINRDRAANKSVDKSVNTLNSLLGSLNIKPVQKKEDAESALGTTPLGVWLYRYENEKPLPDKYPDSPILKYVFTWMGHLCKMLGVKGNKYTQLYEEEIRKNTVERPEYEGDDDLEEQYLEFLEDTPSYNDIT